MNRYANAALLCLFTASCSSPPDGGGPPEGKGPQCAALDHFPDIEDLADSPREDSELEYLAIDCSEGWVADQDVYDQLVADIATIRGADPRMAQIEVWKGRPDGQTFLIETNDADVHAAFIDGTDPEFQCVVDALDGKVTGRDFATDDESFWSMVETPYPLDRRAGSVFEQVEGVHQADPNFFAEDGDRIYYDVRSDPRRYVFDDAGGDCPAGCTTHHYFLWEVSDGASPTLVADWNVGEEAAEGMPPAGFELEELICTKCPDGRVAQNVVETCDDGIDNDCDGKTDCDDDTCADTVECGAEDCGNGADDNADGKIDCDDDDCQFSAACGTKTCGGAGDRAILDRQGGNDEIIVFAARDALACDGETLEECMTATFVRNGGSEACGACFGEIGRCAMDVCTACETEAPFAAACIDCIKAECGAPAEDCLGEPLEDL